MKTMMVWLLLLTGTAWAQIPCSASGPVTGNLGLNIPAHNSAVNTWDALLNANFSCLDQYLSGVTTLPALKVTAMTVPGAASGSYVKADGSGSGTPSGGCTNCTVASGQVTFTANTYTAGTCGSVQTITATGANAGTDRIDITPTADWTTVSGGGFEPAAGNPLTIVKFIATDAVKFKACNYGANDITTTASVTANWGVTR